MEFCLGRPPGKQKAMITVVAAAKPRVLIPNKEERLELLYR